MKKRGSKIQVNFTLTNRWLYTLIVFLVLVIISVGVYAYNSGYNDPSVLGHSADEIEEADPKVGTITNNKWCIGSGDQVVCNQNAPSLSEFDTLQTVTDRGASTDKRVYVDRLSIGNVPLYRISNSRCNGVGGLTFSSTCSTRICFSALGFKFYYNCAGSCLTTPDATTPNTCSNTFTGIDLK